MAADIKLSPAMEDYIETIMLLENSNKVARVSDIGRQLSVRKASVVAAVSYLQKNGLIKHERYGFITLTDQGKVIADKIYRKHTSIKEFLTDVLKVPEERAKDEACCMEHSLSDESVDKLIVFLKTQKPMQPKPVKKGKKA
ncbi:MAG: metal-dependent transcriptional regulator [Spirochaetia bacterium]|nr:metal-dependent transcriptional regulator [Spirochaetia bacterium]